MVIGSGALRGQRALVANAKTLRRQTVFSNACQQPKHQIAVKSARDAAPSVLHSPHAADHNSDTHPAAGKTEPCCASARAVPAQRSAAVLLAHAVVGPAAASTAERAGDRAADTTPCRDTQTTGAAHDKKRSSARFAPVLARYTTCARTMLAQVYQCAHKRAALQQNTRGMGPHG